MAKLSQKGEKTRQMILETAFDLFHERGFYATSVDDILKASGTGKSQFYYHFKSKEAVVHELLQGVYHQIKNGNTHFKDIRSWDDFRSMLDAVIEKHQSHECQRACPIGQICAQISEEDELLRQDLKLIFEAMKEYPKTFFVQLKARGELQEDADPDIMADICIAGLQGAGLLAKVHRDEKIMRNAADMLYRQMYSFMK